MDTSHPVTYLIRKSLENLLNSDYDILFRADKGAGVFKFENKEISMDGYLCLIKKYSRPE